MSEPYISVVTEDVITSGTLLGPLPLSSGSPDSLAVLTWRCVDKLSTSKQVLKTVLETKREEFGDDALIYAKSLCDLEISFKPPRTIRRKHIFGDGDRVTAEIRKRFQQLPNLAQKYAFLSPEVILSMDDFNLDSAPQDINIEEFHLERVRLQTIVAAKDPGCKKELIRSGLLGLLKYIVESKLEDGLPNIVIMLRIFLTAISIMPVARKASLS
ncbi:uncharacterized protein TNCV_4806131 [Trichonephila clavipes]|nr:uncharacterized protein TNCV_4806131 [Trichonephila clavipes]